MSSLNISYLMLYISKQSNSFVGSDLFIWAVHTNNSLLSKSVFERFSKGSNLTPKKRIIADYVQCNRRASSAHKKQNYRTANVYKKTCRSPPPQKKLSMLKIPWVQCSNIQFKVKFSVLVTVKIIFRGSVRVGVTENWDVIFNTKKV